MAITNINYIELKGCVVDELHVRKNTDSSVNLTSSKDTWQIDTYLLPKFQGDLEAGTIDNSGMQITQFAIQRRRISELIPITLGYVPYQNGSTISYTDYTQANDTYIYSIVPVGQNGLLGNPSSVQIDSDFVGWWIVDKDNPGNVLGFDKVIDSNGSSVSMVSTQLQQGRIEVQTMSPFPQVFYTPQQFHKFSLQAVLLPNGNDRTGTLYKNVLNNFIVTHKPCLVKGSDGSLYVCDISNPKKDVPMNSYRGFDYITLTLDFTEIQNYNDYMGVINS